MESLLQNDDALARYGASAPYLDQLTDRDLAALLPAIVKAIEELAPSDEMFGDGIRLAGLDLLVAPAHSRGHAAVRVGDGGGPVGRGANGRLSEDTLQATAGTPRRFCRS